jgi:uncharacterized membrane protein YdbT with pleckstrin-like domain
MSEKRRSPTSYGWALRLFPILCVVGLVVLLVGAISRHSAAMRFGSAVFLLGIAVWAFANGFQFVRAFILGAQLHGWRASFRNPWSALIFILLMIFFLWFGTRVVLFIVRTLHAMTSNQSLQLTAGRFDASHEIMKTLPLQSALAFASGR